MGTERRKQSRVAEMQGVRTMERGGDSQVIPGLLSHGKKFRPYVESAGKLVKYSEQVIAFLGKHWWGMGGWEGRLGRIL